MPIPLTSFVGREREVGEVIRLLQRGDVRLLTLVGPGGVGKTRLAVQAASSLACDFPDGVWFVDLAPLTDPALVIPTVARTLGLQESGEDPIEVRLAAFFRKRRALLVIDNLEQVITAAPDVAQLLANCPELVILVTSREPLAVGGEQQYPVAPLATDGEADAVRLFVERARSNVPGFALTREVEPLVIEICRRLDGLPLAIELAAARIKTLPLADLLARLEHRLPLLTGTRRDVPQRQRTMRDAIAWSYDLLTDPERRLFRQLAVFMGGVSLDAAEAMIAGDPEMDALDAVTLLVEKSLLRQIDGPNGEPRFLMLETVREYGLERLAEAGEAANARDTHAAWYVALAEQTNRDHTGGASAHWLAIISAELDNVRAALARLEETGDAEAEVRILAAIGWFWEPRGLNREGSDRLNRALAKKPVVPPATWALALTWAGWHALRLQDLDVAHAHAEAALPLMRDAGNHRRLSLTLMLCAAVASERRDPMQAAAFLEQAVAIARANDVPRSAASALHNLGCLAVARGDVARAREFVEEALALTRVTGDRVGLVEVTGLLGTIVCRQGDNRRAAAIFEEHLDLCRQQAQDIGLAGLASLAAATGEADLGARLYGSDEAAAEDFGRAVYGGEEFRKSYEDSVASVRAALGEDTFAATWATGRAMPREQAFADAGSFVTRLLDEEPTRSEAVPTHGLSPRETEVLRLIARDWSNQQIADELFLSRRTVHKHVENILAKLGADSRAGAAVWAVRNGVE